MKPMVIALPVVIHPKKTLTVILPRINLINQN